VLRGLPALLLCRAAAALLILALSGAAGLVPRAGAAEHRCQCRGMMVGGHHVCSCPICRLAALRAAARDRTAPPSRRVAAMKALDEQLARPENGGVPCCSSRCDDSSGLAGVSPSVEPFTLQRLPSLARSPMALEHAHASGAPVTRDTFPESPPPRLLPS
jgi:hypothetical protein